MVFRLIHEGVAKEEDFDFRQSVEAVRVSFTPARKGGNLKGQTATRALVPQGIEWLRVGDGGVEIDETPDTDDDEEEEEQGGGSGSGTQPGGGIGQGGSGEE